MKAKTTSLISLLKYCAPNLYRHPASKICVATKKVGGRRKIHFLANSSASLSSATTSSSKVSRCCRTISSKNAGVCVVSRRSS